MRTAMRPRYYCDHCGKGSGSPSAMKRHEAGCTVNPQRVCGMCSLFVKEGGEASATRDELLRVLDAEGFAAMCAAAVECPACILAALRSRNVMDDEYGGGYKVPGPDDGRNQWNYKKAKDDWWRELNDARSDRYT